MSGHGSYPTALIVHIWISPVHARRPADGVGLVPALHGEQLVPSYNYILLKISVDAPLTK